MRVVPALKQDGNVRVYIEVRDGPEIFVGRQNKQIRGRDSTDVPEAVECVDTAGNAIAHVCSRLHARLVATLKDLEIPDELSVEFGVTLGGNAGLPIVTEGPAHGTFKVLAKWTKLRDTPLKGN